MVYIVVLSGVMVSVRVIGPKVRGVRPGRGQRIFMGDKNLQHTFLRMASKAIGPMSKDFTACKNITSKYEQRNF
jgi:hypothetical protein